MPSGEKPSEEKASGANGICCGVCAKLGDVTDELNDVCEPADCGIW